MEQQAISVTTISSYLKNILDNDQLLYRVKVFGEISSVNISNRIVYFGLKDENALLNCVSFNLENIADIKIGDKVIVQGTPNYYIKGGRLSFNVERVEKFGEGELYKNFLLLKQKLEKEGLFDLDRKKAFPKKIKKIGVVTSETGAVIQDIINVTTRRNSEVDLILFPVKVQGINAEYSIARGIDYFNNIDVDAVIIARGGGSEEDLAPFNTEVVARAVADCNKFTLSAVGHEVNYCLIDFVADMRAPTPSAGAELLVTEQKSYLDTFISYYDKLGLLIDRKIIGYENNLANVVLSFNTGIDRLLERKDNQLALLVKDLNSKNPLDILAKGYSKLELDGKRVSKVSQVKVNDIITANLIDGKLIAQVKEIEQIWTMKTTLKN